MGDLISRAAAIEAAIDGADDWDGGYNPERERHIREHIANVPAIDAIPVEWLREWQDEVGTLNGWWPIIERIITVWHEEQEANNGRT